MSIQQFFRILSARKWIIIVATTSCFLAGLIAVLLLPRQYNAAARVMLNTRPDLSTGQSSGGSSNDRTYVPTQMQLVESYNVALRTARNIGWLDSPAQRTAYDAYRTKQGAGSALDFNRWVANQITENVKAVGIGSANTIEVTYTANRPETAAFMANAVRQAYIEERLATKRDEATQAANWLDQQLNDVRIKREEAEQRLSAFQRANNIVLFSDSSDDQSAKYQALARAIGAESSSTVVTSGGGASPQLAAIDSKIASESSALGPNHPKIIELKRQRDVLASSGSGGTTQVRGSGNSAAELAARAAAARAAVLEKSGKLDEARGMLADLNILKEQYESMAARAATLRQQAMTDDASVRPLGDAIPPTSADRPRIPQILIGSFLAGLILGVLAALATEFLRRRVRGADDLINGCGVPLIAVIDPPQGLELQLAG